MKKPFVCVLIFLFIFIFLSGCSQPSEVQVNVNTDNVFSAEYKDMIIKGIIISSDTGQFYMEYATPDELNGLSFSWSNSLTVSYKGLNASTEPDYLPAEGLAPAVRNVFLDIKNSGKMSKRVEDGKYMCSGSLSVGDYSVITDAQGNLLKVTIPDLPLVLCMEDRM